MLRPFKDILFFFKESYIFTSFRLLFLLIAVFIGGFSVFFISFIYYYQEKSLVNKMAYRDLQKTADWIVFSINNIDKTVVLKKHHRNKVAVKSLKRVIQEIPLEDHFKLTLTHNGSNDLTIRIPIRYDKKKNLLYLSIDQHYIQKQIQTKIKRFIELYIFTIICILIIAFGLFVSLVDPFFRIVDVFKKFNYNTVKQYDTKNNEDLYAEINNVKTYAEFNVLKTLLIEFLQEIGNMQRDEINKLLDNIDIGLCIVDKKFEIGNTFSKKTTEILHTETIGNQNLYNIMEPLINDHEKLSSLKDYIDLINNTNVKETFLKSINPFKSILIDFQDPHEHKRIQKHLLFDFNFIKDEEGSIESCVVTIKDNTNVYFLRQKVQQQEKEENQEFRFLKEILKNSPLMIKEFINNSTAEIQDINNLLQENKMQDKELLQVIFRVIHNIKGNASMIELKEIIAEAHELENRINEQLKKEQIKDGAIIDIGIELNSLKGMFKTFNNLIEKISLFTKIYYESDKEVFAKNLIEELFKILNQFTQNINLQNKKNIALDFSQFNHEKIIQVLSHESLFFIKDVFIQFVQNSVVHGVETMEERVKKNKLKTATLKFISEITSEDVKLIFSDDGKGIDEEMIKEKAKSKGIDVTDKTQQEIFNLIFLKEFSTAKSITEEAGRGMGMDIVNEAVQKMKGRIEVESELDLFTRFIITLPINEKK